MAETHDFGIRFAGRIEVGAALAAADRKTCQSIFENLFETEELNDTGIYVRLETKAAFVGPDCTVELTAITDIRVDFALVVFPDNAESEHSFRFNNTIQDIELFIFGMFFDNRFERR